MDLQKINEMISNSALPLPSDFALFLNDFGAGAALFSTSFYFCFIYFKI